MSALLYVRLILGILFLMASVVFFIIEILGVYKMKYVMNRMHSAAIGDAMALVLAIIGLIILNGFNFTTFKLVLVPLFVFCSSPVSSHLIASMEIDTKDEKEQFRVCNVRELDDLSEEE